MANGLQLKVRRGNKWIRNFHVSAWSVRNDDNQFWIPMFPQNTKVRNPDFDETQAESEENPLWLQVGGPDVNES